MLDIMVAGTVKRHGFQTISVVVQVSGSSPNPIRRV
jgi:hypothetical protein